MMEVWGPGVPSAVNPDHHAALAAEGVPAGRIERPEVGPAGGEGVYEEAVHARGPMSMCMRWGEERGGGRR